MRVEGGLPGRDLSALLRGAGTDVATDTTHGGWSEVSEFF